MYMRAIAEFLIIYPQAGNTLYEGLARRLATAIEENRRSAISCSASAVRGMDEGSLSRATVAMIAPAQCYKSLPDRDSFSRRVSEAQKRLMILAEATETVWFEDQFNVPVEFDALIDIGFVSQYEKLGNFELPYHFLFNALDRQEKQMVEQAPVSERAIPWATIGHDRGDRAELAHELANRLDPGGLVFLPPSGVGVRKENGMIDSDGLHTLLRKTRYYVWTSLHDFDYYESFRFREAILAGAMPCKIDSRTAWENTGIPGIFPSVEAFAEHANSGGFETLLNPAREFYLSRGLLTDKLEGILESV
jgi:hypothetical protein